MLIKYFKDKRKKARKARKVALRAAASRPVPRTEIYDPAASPTFCVLPWIHTHFTTDGQGTLCCISPDHLPAPDGGALNIQRHSLQDIFHSQAMDDARLRLLRGEKLDACKACYEQERVGNSGRTYYNSLWQRRDPDLMARITASQEKAAFDKPRSADFRFGNLCNLECQICNPHNSSTIERGDIVSKWNNATYQRIGGGRFPDGVEWYETPEFEAEAAEFSADLEYIVLGGGEPSINKTTHRWFEKLIESGQAAKINIHINTNLTNVNQKFFDLVAQFKRAELNLSIDGFGPLNDYLRYPSKWRIVERNADTLQRMAETHNIHINANPVVNAYNALSIVHLFEWADKRKFGIIANQVRGVDQLDCALIPAEARKLVITRMQSFQETAANRHPTYHTIDAMIRYLELPIDEGYAAKCRGQFHQFTRELDDERGLHFEDYSPEMASFLGYSSKLAA